MRRVYDIVESTGKCKFLYMLDMPHEDNDCAKVKLAPVSYTHLDVYKRQGKQRAYLWNRVKNDVCDQAVIHWSMSLCRDQRESGNGTYVAGVDTDHRDLRDIDPGDPGDI